MDRTVKGTIAVVLIAIILGIAYYGSYLPVRKAQSYIATLQSLQATPPTSLQDLETRLEPSLNAVSPIGQEEIVRNTANSVLGLLQNGIDPTSTMELMTFLNGYYDPILSRGKGMSFGQDLYLEGAVNELAFADTNDPTYLEAAQHYYLEGEALGPNRPQPLYGMLDVYRAEGDVTDTVATAEKILSNWPTDTSVQGLLAQLKGATTTIPTSTQ